MRLEVEIDDWMRKRDRITGRGDEVMTSFCLRIHGVARHRAKNGWRERRIEEKWRKIRRGD